MTQKNKNAHYSFESQIDGPVDYDPDFNLDAYINKMSHKRNRAEKQPATEDDRSHFKNAVLIFLVFAASYLWINNWSISQAWNSLFGGDEVSVVTAPEAPSVDISTFPVIPDNPMAPGEMSSEGFTEFLSAAYSNGLDQHYSNIGLQTMYEAGVPIEYLNQLTEAGISDLSFPAVITFHGSGVSVEYLLLLNESGYLQTQSFPAVVAYYETGVTPEFLDQLNENGLLQQMSFTDVINALEADN